MLIIMLLTPVQVFAQIAISNPVITAVGNPPADQKPKIGGTLVEAAEDLVNAYRNCDQAGFNGYKGITVVSQARSGCLRAQLGTKYSGDNLTIASNMDKFSDNDENVPAACAECTEFVVQALILAYGGADRKAFNPDCAYACVPFNGNWPVAQNWETWNNNGHIYTKVPGHQPQPGDIASTNDDPAITGNATAFGHVLIVKDVRQSDNTFTGLESNWSGIPGYGLVPQCYVADTVDYHPFKYYSYWRLQQ